MKCPIGIKRRYKYFFRIDNLKGSIVCIYLCRYINFPTQELPYSLIYKYKAISHIHASTYRN